ncbi:MarR family winged helix-turn-helix transcriptional regulator [Salibacterium aidingense]|uniref:MarR family winged helix-turn-helix transcriptional regulator n=1 Tax=Salibacterium aidingense TaxID=384933 RepID=UPI0003F5488B|nr:MarR family transcriptional regulator [Salibacterium aidingense]
MNNEEKGEVARNLLTLFPLINKKLFPPFKSWNENDLNITHFFILRTLEEVGDLTLTQIGKKLSIQKSNVTPLVQKLEKSGFIQRQPSPSDRRVKYMSLTEGGADYLKRHEEDLEMQMQKNLESLKEEDLQKLRESVLQLQSILAKID